MKILIDNLGLKNLNNNKELGFKLLLTEKALKLRKQKEMGRSSSNRWLPGNNTILGCSYYYTNRFGGSSQEKNSIRHENNNENEPMTSRRRGKIPSEIPSPN